MEEATASACDCAERRASGPRERALEEGVTALGDAELVAVLLGTGMVGQPVGLVAASLLERWGGLPGLVHAGARVIAEHAGVGTAKALRLVAALELGRRACDRAARPREALRHPSAVAEWFAKRLASIHHEEMWAVAVDGRNGLRSARRVAQGGLHGCSVSVRDILRIGLAEAASALVLVHNHPSGDPTPSTEDLAMTRAVVTAGSVVGLPLLDHVIVTTDGRYSSLFDLGLLDAVS